MWIKRSGIIYIIFIILFCLLTFRLFYISFGSVSDKVKKVAGGRNATITLYNSKGIIYDRNLYPLAGGHFSYYLVINPREFDRSQKEYIAKVTDVTSEELTNKLNKEKPFVLQSYQKIADIEGVTVIDGTTRYPENSVAQHLIGYLDSDGIVGLSGIEKAYSDVLEQYLNCHTISYATNAVQGAISNIELKDHMADTDSGLVLTIDKMLSDIAEQSLSAHSDSGCVIVMDASNGELLVMSSSPEFDVSKITEYINSDNGELINNCMVNQTVGSVFKTVVSIAALQLGYENFKFDCNGGINVSGRVFCCQNNKKHGEVNLETAFAKSCNSYFIALGQLIGYEKIIETAQLLGVDSNIEICKNVFSSAGQLPEDSGALALANLSIGQGTLMMTPLAVTRITAAVCNGGFLVNPTVYSGWYDNDAIINKSDYKYKSNVFDSEISEKLRNMFIKCVEEGTGYNAAPEYYGAGGKTASAQTGIIGKEGKEVLNTYFTGFFPKDNPKYVITVFAKDGESGSETCAPVFKEICDFIYQNY